MNRITAICTRLPLAILSLASSVHAAIDCTMPIMAPQPGALYIDRDERTARLDDRYDISDPRRAAFIDGVLRQHPDNQRLRLGRGSALAIMNRRKAALADYAVLIKRYPEDAHVRWSYGWALFNLGDDTCALSQWRRAARLDGGHPSWLPYALAQSYSRLGRRRLALRWFDAAAQAQPSRWSSAASIRASTYGRNWSDAQRHMLIDMLHAWQQRSGLAKRGGKRVAMRDNGGSHYTH